MGNSRFFQQFCNVVDHGAALTGLHFGRHLDANLGGARSQHCKGFSSFDTRKKNMFVKHQKNKPVYSTAHTRCRLGAATLGSVNEANLTVLYTSFNFMAKEKIYFDSGLQIQDSKDIGKVTSLLLVLKIGGLM